MKEDFRQALIKTLPILCGYAFLGFAFGILLQKAGFNVFWALLISTVVYAGSLQFLLVSFMAAAAPLLNVFAASLFINSRHLFYGISFIDRFRKAKRYCPYLVFSLTDETYSVLCAERDSGSYFRQTVVFNSFAESSVLDYCIGGRVNSRDINIV